MYQLLRTHFVVIVFFVVTGSNCLCNLQKLSFTLRELILRFLRIWFKTAKLSSRKIFQMRKIKVE